MTTCWNGVLGERSMMTTCWNGVLGDWSMINTCWSGVKGDWSMMTNCWNGVLGDWSIMTTCWNGVLGERSMMTTCWKGVLGDWPMKAIYWNTSASLFSSKLHALMIVKVYLQSPLVKSTFEVTNAKHSNLSQTTLDNLHPWGYTHANFRWCLLHYNW